jgi:heme oxygenase
MKTAPESTVKISFNSFFETPKTYHMSDILGYMEEFVKEAKEEFPNIKFNINAEDVVMEFRKGDVQLMVDKNVINSNYAKELEEYLKELCDEVTRVTNMISSIQTFGKI